MNQNGHYQVQWRVNKGWRASLCFDEAAQAEDFARARMKPGSEYRIFNHATSRELTEAELRLLINITISEGSFWLTAVGRYFRNGRKRMHDIPDSFYEQLDVIHNEYSSKKFFKLKRSTLRVLLSNLLNAERAERLRRKARLVYGSDDVEVDECAQVNFSEGGSFVQAWLWVPETGDGRTEAG